ncbi:unnamed protein product, partial [Effrenium voratum]
TTCSTCQRDFLSGAYFCANCGQKRGYSKPVSTLQSRMPATSTPTIRRAQDNFSTQRSPFEAPEGACAPPEEEPEGLGRRVSEVDSNFTAVAVELHNAKYASMPTQAMHAAPPLPSPAPAWKVCTNSAKGAATVALDLSGNGMPDVYVKGADLDNDGIPDILQQTGGAADRHGAGARGTSAQGGKCCAGHGSERGGRMVLRGRRGGRGL